MRFAVIGGCSPRPNRQCVQLPDEELVTGHAQVCPGFCIGDLALVQQFKSVRIGAEQIKPAALLEGKDVVPVGHEAAVLPEPLSSLRVPCEAS